jgi:hypothetical protein
MYAVTLTTTSAFRDRSDLAASRSSSGSRGAISAPSVTEPTLGMPTLPLAAPGLDALVAGWGDDLFASVASDTSLEAPLATSTDGGQ